MLRSGAKEPVDGIAAFVPIRIAERRQEALQGRVVGDGHLNADQSSRHIRDKLAGQLRVYADYGVTTVVVLGTGPGEKYQGKAEIKTAYTEIFRDFDKGTLTHSCYWRDGRGSSTMVWGAAMCKFTDAKGEKKREYELNVSTVAEKQGGKWQFVLMHYSNVVGSTPNQ